MLSQTATGLIGNTPLVELSRIQQEENLPVRLLAKVEGLNPTGSVKDRVAKAMIEDAEEKNLIQPDSVIIEPTSGNTGIGLCAVAAQKHYRIKIIMPDSMSPERRQFMKAYGAEVILTPGSAGMQGSIEKANSLARKIPNSFVPGQFTNPVNPAVHYATTGPEIWNDCSCKIDILVCCVGTGGTITGTGSYLRERNPALRVIAVEPSASPVLSGGRKGSHKIEGIGAGFIPSILDLSLIDDVITVSDANAFLYTRMLAEEEGIFAGISSGAAVAACVQAAKRIENREKTIVCILPDSGDRYLSAGVFPD